jgi:hypothetical protein
MRDLAVLYEHPAWLAPLFAKLDERGFDWMAIPIQDHVFDPAAARAIFNRLAMSSIDRQAEHGLFHILAALDAWEGAGARVINGAGPLAYDLSKARQMALFRRAGLETPCTLVAHRRADIPAMAARIGYPVIVKANVGGSGSGVAVYDSAEALDMAGDSLPMGVDGVVLVQDRIPARDGRVIRCELMAGRLLYAIALDGAGSTFDLCPADVCLADKPTITVSAFQPPAAIRSAVERVGDLAGLDVGGVEYMIDDRDGKAKFFDFNGMSNFVAKPHEVLGFDPHDDLADFLAAEIAAVKASA